jgi:hypothetical protein
LPCPSTSGTSTPSAFCSHSGVACLPFFVMPACGAQSACARTCVCTQQRVSALCERDGPARLHDHDHGTAGIGGASRPPTQSRVHTAQARGDRLRNA